MRCRLCEIKRIFSVWLRYVSRLSPVKAYENKNLAK